MAKRVLGGISFLMGLTIMAWFAYNLIWPTREFQRSFRSVFQLIVPAAMILSAIGSTSTEPCESNARSSWTPPNNEMPLTRSAHGQTERGPCS